MRRAMMGVVDFLSGPVGGNLTTGGTAEREGLKLASWTKPVLNRFILW